MIQVRLICDTNKLNNQVEITFENQNEVWEIVDDTEDIIRHVLMRYLCVWRMEFRCLSIMNY